MQGSLYLEKQFLSAVLAPWSNRRRFGYDGKRHRCSREEWIASYLQGLSLNYYFSREQKKEIGEFIKRDCNQGPAGV